MTGYSRNLKTPESTAILKVLLASSKRLSSPEVARLTGLEEDLVYAEFAILRHYGVVSGEYEASGNPDGTRNLCVCYRVPPVFVDEVKELIK